MSRVEVSGSARRMISDLRWEKCEPGQVLLQGPVFSAREARLLHVPRRRGWPSDGTCRSARPFPCRRPEGSRSREVTNDEERVGRAASRRSKKARVEASPRTEKDPQLPTRKNVAP